jgi:ferredoxin
MNILDFAATAEKLAADLDRPIFEVDDKRCLNRLNRAAACNRCVLACPVDAIRVLNGQVQVDGDRCAQCGACVGACPVEVFRGRDPLPSLITCIDNIVDKDVLELACSVQPPPSAYSRKTDALVRVHGCLASLAPSAYISALALGVRQLIVRTDACPGCPLSRACDTIHHAVSQAQSIVAGRGEAERLIEQSAPARPSQKPVYSTRNPPLSRRRFFGYLVGRREMVVAALLPSDDSSAVGKHIPLERRRLLAALQQLPARQDVPAELPFAAISATKGCTACGTCERVCTTGAIRLEKSDREFHLTFDTSACVDCGQCLTLCQPKVLRREAVQDLSEFVNASPRLLAAGSLRQCRKCKARFAGDGDLCPVCQLRANNPFRTRSLTSGS